MATDGENLETLLVGVWLRGEEVERFLRYKEKSTLTKNGTAGRKLLVERLNEVEPKPEAELVEA
jgi:hypothetical protein